MLVYVHGFNSSALSFKANVLRKRMTLLARGDEFACPELPPSPKAAIALLEDVVAAQRGKPLTLVGSSLGGYYATWLTERHKLRTVLVNPAVRPYELLAGYVGPQVNLYTGARYDLTHAHIAELEALDVERVTPERYLLMVTTGDEVLDYRTAVERYRGAEQLVIEGSDHGFGDFEAHLDRVLAFARVGRPV